MDLFPTHAASNATYPALVPAFGDPSLEFRNLTAGSANTRFVGSLPALNESSYVPGVGFSNTTASFDHLTLGLQNLNAAADQTNAAFLKNQEVYRLERRRGLYQVVSAAAAMGSIVERTAIAPALAVEHAIHTAAEGHSGSGNEGQHADSIFASAGLVRADDVGQVDGHQAYYQSHSVFGHELVDKSHIIVGGAQHDVPTHAASEAASHTASAADHSTHGVASQEMTAHSASGHDTSAHTLSQQQHGGSFESAGSHDTGAVNPNHNTQSNVADGGGHAEASGDHKLLATAADLHTATEAGYSTEQAKEEGVVVSKPHMEGTEVLAAERATERAERPERQAVKENIMRAMVPLTARSNSTEASAGVTWYDMNPAVVGEGYRLRDRA